MNPARIRFLGPAVLLGIASLVFMGCGGDDGTPPQPSTSDLINEVSSVQSPEQADFVASRVNSKIQLGSGVYNFVDSAQSKRLLAAEMLNDFVVPGSTVSFGTFYTYVRDQIIGAGPTNASIRATLQAAAAAAWASPDVPENALVVLALTRGTMPAQPPIITDDTLLTNVQAGLLSAWFIANITPRDSDCIKKAKRKKEQAEADADRWFRGNSTYISGAVSNSSTVSNALNYPMPSTGAEVSARVSVLMADGVISSGDGQYLNQLVPPLIDGPATNHNPAYGPTGNPEDSVSQRKNRAQQEYDKDVADCHNQ